MITLNAVPYSAVQFAARLCTPQHKYFQLRKRLHRGINSEGPELRYDWFSADEGGPNGPVGTMPYGRLNEQNAQFYGGCDIIWQF